MVVFNYSCSLFQLAMLLHGPDEPPGGARAQQEDAVRSQKVLGESRKTQRNLTQGKWDFLHYRFIFLKF